MPSPNALQRDICYQDYYIVPTKPSATQHLPSINEAPPTQPGYNPYYNDNTHTRSHLNRGGKPHSETNMVESPPPDTARTEWGHFEDQEHYTQHSSDIEFATRTPMLK